MKEAKRSDKILVRQLIEALEGLANSLRLSNIALQSILAASDSLAKGQEAPSSIGWPKATAPRQAEKCI